MHFFKINHSNYLYHNVKGDAFTSHTYMYTHLNIHIGNTDSHPPPTIVGQQNYILIEIADFVALLYQKSGKFKDFIMNRINSCITISSYSPVNLICPSSSSRMLKRKKKLLTIVSDSILATFLKKQNSMHKDTVVCMHENESSGGDTLEVHFFFPSILYY